MALPSGIRAGRRRARRNMPDEVAIYRIEREWNEATGLYDEATTTVYLGPGSVNTYEPHESPREVGGVQRIVQRYSVKILVDEPDVQVGDIAVFIRATYLPMLTGRQYTTAGLHAVSRGVSQRLLTDQEVSP